VLGLLRSGEDGLSHDGASYERLARELAPLRYALGAKGVKLTATGVYYMPFGDPASARAAAVMLHVADGSQLIARRAGGPSVFVQVGSRRFASCKAGLADGWLPILQTRDGGYRQESFAAADGGVLASYVRLDGPGLLAVGAVTGRGTLYVRWAGGPVRRIGATDYVTARRRVVQGWRDRLGAGATVRLPDRRVMNALRALLVQQLTLTWRYSVGNSYEEFSFPEGVDVAEVAAAWGFGDLSAAILRRSLTRPPNPYPAWKMGEKLLGSALHYRLVRDPAYVRDATPVLRGYVSRLEHAAEPSGLLQRERYSSDIPDQVYGLHAQAIVWEGLRLMAGVWDETGEPALARQARALATRLGTSLRTAVRRSQQVLADGSLFVPMKLLDAEPAYTSLTQARGGSYWNLVAPYALQSGLFGPDTPEARGALRYLLHHGARLGGLVRAGAYALYGRDAAFPVSGTDEVYGKNVARFLADVDQPNELGLSLYGQLALAMTPGTFVAGEGASVAPLRGQWYRSMYLPPNGASGASFLETLRLMLVHETAHGLQLAWSTPRAWLAGNRRIVVRRLPTTWGPVSYTLGPQSLSIDVPARAPRDVRVRVRTPTGTRVIDLSGRTGHVALRFGPRPSASSGP
jgi:hypothetical protein